MDSFFFNITDKRYQIKEIFNKKEQHVTRVDISNGLVFFDIALNLNTDRVLKVKNLDRMNFIVSVANGKCQINDKISNKTYQLNESNTYLFATSSQNFEITLSHSNKTEIFILFIADFFIKRYLSDNSHEPINTLYQKIQTDVSLELIHSAQTDALSLYLIDKIIHAKNNDKMNSIISEHRAIEYIIHRLSLLEFIDTNNFNEQQIAIAQKAKSIIQNNYINPPSIKELAHLCATNDFKLKSYFKLVNQTTIYAYVQKLRLDNANLLLREQLLSVAQVANAVGYKHSGHFSAIFYKTYGVYPKDLKSI
ncbi:helix-turn-helix transcriptional regulator [Pseudoalteromonas denitrificans]|uniref:Transcriptional regulator, AraC family n=1 Tax=Pseudoalteromonas denitrificans DSM 6059 TaxID=1123010 RepID=A0A1I1UD62_9GAMM|nr:helix-turn-helix transcriptional regulator [Pseudoalteromonas denitrificans]SFD66713.1 transcriptional regulator, AraC family [Pseudoalteromonas denitrificans DSM 6059]